MNSQPSQPHIGKQNMSYVSQPCHEAVHASFSYRWPCKNLSMVMGSENHRVTESLR